jgi:hypothetical protein
MGIVNGFMHHWKVNKIRCDIYILTKINILVKISHNVSDQCPNVGNSILARYCYGPENPPGAIITNTTVYSLVSYNKLKHVIPFDKFKVNEIFNIHITNLVPHTIESNNLVISL